MRKSEKKKYLEKKSVAYWSGCDGLEIKEIEYGINDYVICVSGVRYGKPVVHRVKVEGDYFRVHDYRIPFDECIRM